MPTFMRWRSHRTARRSFRVGSTGQYASGIGEPVGLAPTWLTDEVVNALAVAPDDETLAAGCAQGAVTLWQVGTGKIRATLRRHSGDVLGLAFSPDGLTLATTGSDKTVRIWDPATERELLTLTGHQGSVHAATFSPDGGILATGGHDGVIKLWRSEPSKASTDRPEPSVVSAAQR